MVLVILDAPWTIDFLPGREMIFTERGRVSAFDNGKLKVVGNIQVSEVPSASIHTGLGTIVECDKIAERYVNPMRCYSEFTLTPSGVAFYNLSSLLPLSIIARLLQCRIGRSSVLLYLLSRRLFRE